LGKPAQGGLEPALRSLTPFHWRQENGVRDNLIVRIRGRRELNRIITSVPLGPVGCGKPKAHRIVRISGLMRLAIDAVRFAHHILWVIRGLPKKRGQRPYSLQTEMFSDPFCESTDGCAPPFSDGSRSPQRTEERADFFRQELRLFHGSEVPALGHRRPPFDIEHPLDP